MLSKRRKPETSAASLSQDKAKKKAKTTQSTLPPRIHEWAALLPAEPEDQDPKSRAVRSESVSSGLTSVSASPSIPLYPSLHEDDGVREELSASRNDHFPSTYSDVATDGNVVEKKVIPLEKKDDPDHTLDLAKFPGYMYSEPTKRPHHGWIWVHGHDIQHQLATRSNGKAKRRWVCKICKLILIISTPTMNRSNE